MAPLPIESAIVEALRAASSPALTRVMWVITLAGDALVVTAHIALAAAVLWARGAWRRGVLLAVAVAAATGLSEALKALVDRARPPLGAALIAMPGNASFPSGHAISSLVLFVGFAVLLTLGHESARVRVGAIAGAAVAAALVGVSRVYLGVHWPGDVLASWLLGAAVIAATARAAASWGSGGTAGLEPRARTGVTVAAAVGAVGVLVVEMCRHPLG